MIVYILVNDLDLKQTKVFHSNEAALYYLDNLMSFYTMSGKIVSGKVINETDFQVLVTDREYNLIGTFYILEREVR